MSHYEQLQTNEWGMRTYPIVQKPLQVLWDMNSSERKHSIPDSLKEPTPPTKPIKEESAGIFGILLIVSISLFFFYTLELSVGFLFLIFGTGTFLYLYFSHRADDSNYKQAEEKFMNDWTKYSTEQDIYKLKLLHFKKQVDTENQHLKENNEELIRHRVSLLLGTLAQIKKGEPPDYRKDYKKGVTEKYFYSKMNEWFGDKIYSGVGIPCKGLNTVFVPDFLLYDDLTNLHIAIEIDEPYSLKDKQLLHYFFETDGLQVMKGDFIINQNWMPGSTRPECYFRSDEITNAGWIIIRFAEEQIVRNAEGCCNYINEFITFKLYLNIDRKKLGKKATLSVCNCWTLKDANNLLNQNYRQHYLKELPLFEEFSCTRNYSDYSKSYDNFSRKQFNQSI